MMEEGLRPEAMLPEAFTDKMRSLLGEEYESFLKSYDVERVQGLRFNSLKGSPDEMADRCRDLFGLRKVPWCREGHYYAKEARPGRHPYHEAGVYYIQEPSAMAVVELLDPQPGDLVLDLCAAPGGKTTHIAERLAGSGLLVSNEIYPARVKILSQNVERMGIPNAVVTNEESGRLAACFMEFFDRIVVDAPCSGEGMFRKDEQARREWSEANVKACVTRQQEILDNAARMLKTGGRMVYSTCTFSPEENEDGIARFLERHPEFSIERMDGFEGLSPGMPEWIGRKCQGLEYTFRVWPHKAEGEGHYLAVLKKGGSADGVLDTCPNAGKRWKSPRYWKDKAGIRPYLEFEKESLWKPVGGDCLILYGEQLYRVPPQMPDFKGLRVLRPGLHLGTFRKGRFEPSHALALALKPEQAVRKCLLSAEGLEIQRYLSGNTLLSENVDNGWVLVCVDGYSIGWAKAVSGVLKNHYPKGIRIPNR